MFLTHNLVCLFSESFFTGFYDPIRRTLNTLAGDNATNVQLWSSLSAGALSGFVGAVLSHPLLLLKSQIQIPTLLPATISTTTTIPYTERYTYRSTLEVLTRFVRQEGIRGWMRGADVVLFKTALASSAQLPAYNLSKTWLRQHFEPDSLWRYVVSSSFSAMCGVAVIQPIGMYQSPLP